MRYWLYSVLLGLTLLCGSCIHQSDFEVDRVELNPTLSLPLVHGRLQIADLLNDDDSSHFSIDEDGLMFLSYSDELVSESVRDLFNIPGIEVTKSFVMPGVVIPPHNEDIRFDSIQTIVTFDLDPELLNEIALNAGRISYSVVLAPQSVNLGYEVFLALDGYKSRTTGKKLNTAMTGQGTIDLSDYTITLDGNNFLLKLVLVLKQSNAPTTVPPATSVNVKLNFENFGFDYIKGYFGEQETAMDPQSLELGIFDNDIFADADVTFAQPQVSITVANENGVPCTVHFNKLEARKEGKSPLAINTNPASPVSLAYPTGLGDTKNTHLDVVNVSDLMSYAPSEIFYQADVHINEGLTEGENFMIDSSAMNVRLNVKVPLWGSASGLVLQDTLDVDLEGMESSEVYAASLNVDLVNEMPLDGTVQFILTDEQHRPLGTLLLPEQTNIIKGSVVDANGVLETAGEYSDSIELDKTKIEDLFKAKHIILVATMRTSRNEGGSATAVKFLADYGLSVNVGVAASLKLSVE